VVLDPQFPDLVSKTLIMTLGSKPNYYLSVYEKNAVAGHHNIKWEYSGVLKCFHCINPLCIQHGLLTDIQSDYRPDIKKHNRTTATTLSRNADTYICIALLPLSKPQ